MLVVTDYQVKTENVLSRAMPVMASSTVLLFIHTSNRPLIIRLQYSLINTINFSIMANEKNTTY